MPLPYKLFLLILALILTGCKPDYQAFQTNDVSTFHEQLNLARNPEAFKNYQQYGQNDKLRVAILAVQYKHYDKAEKILEPLAKKGEPEAMFWLAAISYASGILDAPQARQLWMDSASKGDPYAAWMFAKDNYICQLYFKDECSDKWEQKAKVLFEKSAKSGDVRAIYYAHKLQKNHKVYIDAIIQAAKSGFLLPMVMYADNIVFGKDSTPEAKKLAIELLYYGADRNFIPAIDALLSLKEDKNQVVSEYRALVEKGVSLGSVKALKSRFWIAYDNKNLEEQSIIAQEIYLLSGSTGYLDNIIYPITDKSKLEVVNKLASEAYDKIPQTIYIDGNHFDNYQNGLYL